MCITVKIKEKLLYIIVLFYRAVQREDEAS